MFRNRLKTILYAFTITLTLSIIMGAQAFTSYEADLEKRLASKKFIQPTEFYTAPFVFKIGTITNKDLLTERFLKLNFRQRVDDQRLLNGDFKWLNKAHCLELFSQTTPAEDLSYCLFFVNKNVSPEDSSRETQGIILNEDGLILSLYKGQILTPIESISLEPELLAQYLNAEPIMQEELALNDIPTYCPNAVMAIEDANFLTHSGFSVTGTLRGLLMPILRGKKPQGGSTITQQLVKNYFLTNERTIKRKAEELILSVLIEKKFTKDQILETYLNIIYMGQNGPFQLLGFGAASKYYFQKKLADISLPECALLAAILNGPGVYNPFTKRDKAIQRRNLVLLKMKDLQLISEHEYEDAKQAPLPVKKPNLASETAPYYLDAVRKQMKELNLPLEGAKIFTGLNLELQQMAQDSLKKHLESLEKDNKKIRELKEKGAILEGAILSADPKNGLVSVAVGGRNFRMTQFNRAIDAHRQVGSIFKPLVYLTALNHNNTDGSFIHPLSLIKDDKFEVKYEKQKWSPENYTKKFYGEVPLYFALKNSLNAATAKIGIDIGLEEIIKTAKSMGATSELKPLPSLTLGSFEMTPHEVLQIYTNMANLGRSKKLSFITSVIDKENHISFKLSNQSEVLFDEASISTLLSVMKQTTKTGSAKLISLAKYPFQVAGKTGTTSDYKDAWFAGITPFMSTIVWVGYDQNLVSGLTGASGAVPIWIDFMKQASINQADVDFPFDETKVRKVVITKEILEKAGVPNNIEPEIETFELLFDNNKIPSFLK